jgi:ubiquinone biosynthesis protein
MASVEGVARRIDPNHDIWSAARPVVERWIARELSPPAQAKRLAERGLRALEGLARWAESTPTPPLTVVAERRSGSAWAWLTAAAAILAILLSAATLLR